MLALLELYKTYSYQNLLLYLNLNLVPLLVLLAEWGMDFISFEITNTFYIAQYIPLAYIPLQKFKNYVLGTTDPAWWSSMPTWEKALWTSGLVGFNMGIFEVIAQVTNKAKAARMTPKPTMNLDKSHQHIADMAAY